MREDEQMKCHFKHIYNELESYFSKLASIVSPFDSEIVIETKFAYNHFKRKTQSAPHQVP
jgi:hypothetical protein